MTATLQDVADKSFDYVIIGGGAAGLTVAARLSEDKDVSVCVLEAGDANLEDPMILRPGGYGTHFGNKLYDWSHETARQKCLKDRVCVWARGRGLGGSTAINFMAYSKPPAEELDDIERLGNPGWNWKNFQKYAARTEGLVEPPEDVQQKFQVDFSTWEVARDGPLTLSYPSSINPHEYKLRETLLNAGLPHAPGPYNGNPNGVFYALNTHDPRTHTRSYATTAHYLPNRTRPNFTVLVQARVNRIGLRKTASGSVVATHVEFSHGGRTRVVHVEKEVIVAAGALRSPKVLELSGIGKRDVLESVGVPVMVDLPGVGENMQEHIISGTSHELKDDVDWDTFDVLRDPAQLAKHSELYEKGEGLFTAGIINLAFVPLDTITDKAKAEEIYNKAQAVLAKVDSDKNPGLKEQYEIMVQRIKPGSNAPGCEIIMIGANTAFGKPGAPGKRYVGVYSGLNYVFSRGSVHIVSDDPALEPEIDPRYDECDVDFDMFVEQVKFTRRLAATSPLKDMIAKEHNPGPQIKTDEQLRDWIGETFLTTWHTTGTCSMLPRDKGGVVDPTLKVYGTDNIRVVDFSIAPLHFASHTQSIVYGMAEQAADIIKGRFTS